MNRDSTTGKFTAAREAINDERVTDTIDFNKVFDVDISMKRILIEMFIGCIWGYALGCAAGIILDAVMLLSLPLIFNLAVYFALLTLTIYVAFTTSHIVASTVYDGVAAAYSASKHFGGKALDSVLSFKSRVFAPKAA